MGKSGFRSPIPTQVVGQSHATCRIALHGVNAAIRRAGSYGYGRHSLRSKTIDPLGGLDRLAGRTVGSHGRPIAVFIAMDLFVGN